MVAATDNVKVAVKAMKQKAVYWELSGLDSFGKPTWEAGVEITCRWEDANEEFINPNGERQLSQSKLIVDRGLTIKGWLWLGELVDVTDATTPQNNSNVWEILMVKKTPDFKGNKYLREAFL